MKVRSPLNIEAPSLDSIPESNSGHSVTYKVKTITPIYGGGVEAGIPDVDMPIRAAAIRGQLRYWWRFLKSNHIDEKKELKSEELFKEERRIWGGMGDEKELEDSGEKDFSGKVFIRCSILKTKSTFKYNNQQSQYALFPARENKREKIEAKQLIHAGITFDLTITCSNEVDFETDIKPALSWWACFGGVGARTRRGVGSVVVKDLESIDDAECKNHCAVLVLQDKEFSNAEDAWEEGVSTLSDFRQKPGVGRNLGNGNTPGRSRWPEPDSIREIVGVHSTKKIIHVWNKDTGRKDKEYQCNDHSPNENARISFPRAAFGLPIVFKFKDENCGEPKQTTLYPDKEGIERMSSPLILTPYEKENGKYVAAALQLPINHLKNLDIKLKKGEQVIVSPDKLSKEKEKEWKQQNWERWPSNWWDASKANDVKPINNNNGSDALTAFMNFFAKGGE